MQSQRDDARAREIRLHAVLAAHLGPLPPVDHNSYPVEVGRRIAGAVEAARRETEDLVRAELRRAVGDAERVRDAALEDLRYWTQASKPDTDAGEAHLARWRPSDIAERALTLDKTRAQLAGVRACLVRVSALLDRLCGERSGSGEVKWP